MAIKNIIAGGVGFSPGSVKFIPMLGFISAVVSASYAAAFGELVPVDPTTGSFVVNLPSASGANDGDVIVIVNDSGLTTSITIIPNGADTANRGSSVVIATANLLVHCYYDDSESNWYVG